MLQSVRNGWVSSEKRRSKRREKEGYQRNESERAMARCHGERSERETEKEREIERAIQGRREERMSEKEREERELAWVPCALVSGYTSYGSEGRYSGKFRVMQQQGLSSLLVVLLSAPLFSRSRIISFASSLLYEEKLSLLLSSLSLSLSLCHDFALARRDCWFRFVFRLWG